MSQETIQIVLPVRYKKPSEALSQSREIISLERPHTTTFLHHPLKTCDEMGFCFWGRDRQIDQFSSLFRDSTRSTVLITGYRGVGKTSLINRVILEQFLSELDLITLKKHLNALLASQGELRRLLDTRRAENLCGAERTDGDADLLSLLNKLISGSENIAKTTNNLAYRVRGFTSHGDEEHCSRLFERSCRRFAFRQQVIRRERMLHVLQSAIRGRSAETEKRRRVASAQTRDSGESKSQKIRTGIIYRFVIPPTILTLLRWVTDIFMNIQEYFGKARGFLFAPWNAFSARTLLRSSVNEFAMVGNLMEQAKRRLEIERPRNIYNNAQLREKGPLGQALYDFFTTLDELNKVFIPFHDKTVGLLAPRRQRQKKLILHVNMSKELSEQSLMFEIIRAIYEKLERVRFRGLDKNTNRILHRAYLRTCHQEEISSQMNSEFGIKKSKLFDSLKFSFDHTRKRVRLPYSNTEAEHDLLNILEGFSRSNIGTTFVLDEVDKLKTSTPNIKVSGQLDNSDMRNSEEERRPKLEQTISDLKRLFTEGKAFFIFIAGKDTYDKWLDDHAKGEGLYESVFSQNIYIPSLLSIDSLRWVADLTPQQRPALGASTRDFCEQVLSVFSEISVEEKEGRPSLDKGEETFYEEFLDYLTFKGRGIPRKILREVLGFLRMVNIGGITYPVLEFSPTQVHRIKFYAYLQQLLDQNFDLIKEWDDHSLVSMYYLIEHILKLSQSGFSWSDIDRAPILSEREEQFPSARVIASVLEIFEGQILEVVPGERRRYQFNSKIKKEIQVLADSLEEEQVEFRFTSADFRKSLAHYQALDNPSTAQGMQSARIQIALASIHTRLNNYSLALLHYEKALKVAVNQILELESSNMKMGQALRTDLVDILVEICTQTGRLHEKRLDYDKALNFYGSALELLDEESLIEIKIPALPVLI